MAPEALPRLTRFRRTTLDRQLDHFLDLEPEERARQLARFRTRYRRLSRWLDRLLEASATPTEHFSGVVARTTEEALKIAEDQGSLAEGDRLGPWQIIGPAGRGGMGVVYRAERADGAFEMQAAIKLIASQRHGMAERLVLERQLLARLNHPGISRLIDGGLTEHGRAYLVMEWVPGEDLSEPLRTRLDPLKTFAEIADALTHAHQRMVVHGDIKPGNVRITPDGRACLLDFGVARLLADDLIEENDSLRALTPAFAAPELLAGQPATAQSDVWALGALLNWLMTGRRPVGEGCAPDSSDLPHPRAADLAAVIGQACAADPAQRYPSVAALREDVDRIRRHFPVQARRSGPLRRLQLWSRRNPVGALLALALTVGAVVGAAGFGWQAQIVRAERDLAQFENMRWEAMRDQLTGLFRVVAEEADIGALGARELLDGSVQRLDQLLAGDDRGRAYLEAMLGSLYVALQDYQSAAAVLRRFVEADDETVSPMLRLDAYGNLGLAEVYLGNHERGLQLVDQALAIAESQVGDRRRRLSTLYATRGSALRELGDWSASIETLERSVALARAVDREPSRALAMALNNLGVSLIRAGHVEQSRLALEESLEAWRAIGMAESTDALTVLSNLAVIYYRQGDLARAESTYAEAIALRRRRFGDSAALAAAMNNYAQVLLVRHRLAEAADQIEPALEMMARFNGENSPHYALLLRSKGALQLTSGAIEEAAAKFSRAEAILLGTVGAEHLFTAIVRVQSTQAKAQGDPAAAAERFEQVIAQLAGLGQPARAHKAGAWCEQAIVLMELDRPGQSQKAAERCLDLRLELLPEDHWEITKAEALVAAAAYRLGDAEARLDLVASVGTLAETYGPGHPRLAWLESRIGP